MSVLRRVVCVLGVLAGVLVFSPQVIAKQGLALHKKEFVTKKAGSGDRNMAGKSSKNAKASRHEARDDRSLRRQGRQLASRDRGDRLKGRKFVVLGSKTSKLARSPRFIKVNLSKQRLREEVDIPDSVELDSAGNPLLRSAAFFVQDVRSGRVLLERNSNAVVPIASITKLMTAMVVLDARLPLDEVLMISESDLDRLKGTGSRLAVGTRMSRENLLRLALMSSENRAASALSQNYPGGLPAFVAAMNAKARSLGMTDTRYFDGSGLNHNNVSSARDLAILVSAASHYPLIREFTTTAEYSVELLDGRVHTFHNTNGLVKSPDWQIEVSKTGFINESGKCLVMQAWLANKPLAIVLLDSQGRYTRQADANRIRRWLEEVLPRNGAKVAGLRSTAQDLN